MRLAGILDAGQLHAEIVTVAMEVTKANRGFLTMLEENNKLRFKWGQNIDQSTLASPAFSYGRGLIKQVLQTGQPLKLPPEQAGGITKKQNARKNMPRTHLQRRSTQSLPSINSVAS